MKVEIEKIKISTKRRKVDLVKAADIAEGISAVGLLHPIVITKDFELVAGAHRIEAAKMLGWEEIDATFFDDGFDDFEAAKEYAECAENILRNPGDVFEQAEQLARMKSAYERMYPATKNGGKNRSNNYGQNLENDKLSFSKSAAESTGKDERTIQRISSLTKIPEPLRETLRKSPLVERKTDLYKIASLPTDEQEKIVEKVREGATTLNEAKKRIISDVLIDKSESLPDGIFQVIYADPPWQYSNSGLNGSANSTYMTMPTKDICDLKIKEMTSENAVCFLWVTNPFLADGIEVLKSWGFEYKTNFVWVKNRSTGGGLGFYVWGKHEILLIGIRGSMLPTGEKFESVINADVSTHSKKPESVYGIIESMYPRLKKVELFARNTREGWSSWGNQI